jgi:tRNA(Arg) A34 adenosine deaminase TadA
MCDHIDNFRFPKVRRSPVRNIKNYQFYVHNANAAIIRASSLDREIYGKVRNDCIDLKNTNTSGRNICACLYDKHGRIISSGVNSFCKSHPMQEKFSGGNPYKIFLHAEIDAVVSGLRKINDDDLSGYSLAIARVCSDGIDGQAFPCDGCIDALKHYKCDAVTYFDEERGLSKFYF